MTGDDRITVVIIDDHEMVRSGLKVFLQAFPDLRLVGEGCDGAEALVLAHTLSPDVVLMDLMMPGLSGAEAIRQVRAIAPHTQVIALSSFVERDMVRHAVEAGAIGYLNKTCSIDALADAIRAASKGRPTMASEALGQLIATAREGPPLGADLSEREREVLALIAAGLTNRQIAQRLTISPATAKTHVSHVLAKLGAASRVEAATLALEHGLAPRPSEGR
jgi:NarL family two-component system response regulator LiaR